MVLEAAIIGFDNYRVGDAIASVSAGLISLMMKYVHFNLIFKLSTIFNKITVSQYLIY